MAKKADSKKALPPAIPLRLFPRINYRFKKLRSEKTPWDSVYRRIRKGPVTVLNKDPDNYQVVFDREEWYSVRYDHSACSDTLSNYKIGIDGYRWTRIPVQGGLGVHSLR